MAGDCPDCSQGWTKNADFTDEVVISGSPVPRFSGEFWTSGQRKGSSLHEISYRACFKPQLPAFFIRQLTSEGDLVYDPFNGRGTTAIEAGLLGRAVAANDINPLSLILTRPRLKPPHELEVKTRLEEIPCDRNGRAVIDLSMFYHPDTEAEIVSLRRYLQEKVRDGSLDDIDEWIRMVATNRLTGHSPGFFSVYTLPPNQAVSPERQVLINKKRNQTPGYRDTKKLIYRKTCSLLKDVDETARDNLRRAGDHAVLLSRDARDTPELRDGSVQLTVTSPPFLDIVQYSRDNWLRCWFNGFEMQHLDRNITLTRSIREWEDVMHGTFRELFRITKVGGYVAFEVGEVRKGAVKLDEVVVPLGIRAGFSCQGILVNLQHFTKTSHIWGIGNNASGTNTNRIVIFKKES